MHCFWRQQMSSGLAMLNAWFSSFEICQKPGNVTYHVWNSLILHSNEGKNKIMLYSGAKDTETSNQVEKMKKNRMFFYIFAPQGYPHPCPINLLWGNLSKIASMAPWLGLKWEYMPNFKSLWWSVWAVGGGTLEGDIKHLQIRLNSFANWLRENTL